MAMKTAATNTAVMPALGAGIHAFLSAGTQGVDPRTKSGDDDRVIATPRTDGSH